MSEIYVIPSTKESAVKKLRVAAYVRVSTDDYDQENSFLNQYDYYNRYIKSNPEWDYIDMYADEGITGTELKHRDEFNRMVDDCKDRKIDLIITKSISRFARNTYDCLKYVRILKHYGTDVKFEKENIDTRKLNGETELAMLSSMAQEESISISKNEKIALKHKMMEGTYQLSNVPYGYERINRTMVIVEEEAKIVRLIYNAYLAGKTINRIVKELNEAGITTKKGKSNWQHSTLKYMLTNITYTGDAIFQKSYGEEFPYKRKWNKGELTKYLVKEYCPAIINKELFEVVQKKLELKSTKRNSAEDAEQSLFAGMLYCQRCGTKLKLRNNGNSFCEVHSKKEAENRLNSIPEKAIKLAFVDCYNRLYYNRESILIPILNHLQEYKGFQNKTDEKFEEINNRIAQVTEQILIISKLKAEASIESAIYMQKSTELNAELTRLKKEKKSIVGNKEIDALIKQTTKIIRVLETFESIAEFDDNIFKTIISKVWIADNVHFIYELINGVKLRINISEV